MSADPFRHSLVHVFLEEELGDQSPPDLTEAILAKALAPETAGSASDRPLGAEYEIRTKPIRWAVPLAAAAAVAIALTVWMLIPAGYPGLKISGDYEIEAGGRLRRGSTITTLDGSAVLELGDYCRVEIQPWTTLRVNGGDYKEQLFVEVGMIDCSVDSDVGALAVFSELGSAEVVGTRFSVCVEESGGLKQMRVKVAEGAVDVSDGWDRRIVRAGGEQTIVEGQARRSETKPATKPVDSTSGGIEPAGPVDPGSSGEFTSSSDDVGSVLREKVESARQRLEAIQAEMDELRIENERLQEELDARGYRNENNEHMPIEIEPGNKD